ncbi:MAG: HAD-like domain-containing protein [Monoraphidium minutum]|nr:MAG: HAD-like domain-containing protein [Monoraphidium minutum]
MARPQVTHVIFDMDGLLLDTETAYTVAQKEILGKYGVEFTWELKAKMMGKKALDAARVMVEDTGLAGQLDPEDFLRQREAILDRLFPEAPLMPGADRLLRHLHANSVPMAVATSSHARHFEIKTQRHRELFGLFDHILTGDMVANGKPAPDIFLQAAAGFKGGRGPESPARCLVFEDAPVGVQAAVAAGMPVVLVPDPNLDSSEVRGAAAIIGSLEGFNPEEWGLPPYPCAPEVAN